MKRLSLTAVALGFAIFCGSGCQLMKSMSMVAPSPSDYRDTTDEEDDEWASVGEEARGNRPVEKDPDQWWRNWLMSGRARAIERNLGIE